MKNIDKEKNRKFYKKFYKFKRVTWKFNPCERVKQPKKRYKRVNHKNWEDWEDIEY